MKGESLRHTTALLLLCLLVAGGYAQAVGHDFVWDDNGLIVQNELIRNQASWSTLLTKNFWQIMENYADQSRSFYRPVITLSYAVEFAVAGLTPTLYHAVNVVLHLLCSWLVYALGLRFFRTRGRALLMAALFAVLPVHVENVYWISGRTDIFCALFYLAAFLGYLQWRRDTGYRSLWFAVMAFSYLLSLLSKEMALSFPLIVVCHYGLFERRRKSFFRVRQALLVLLLITAAYFALRLVVLGRLLSPVAEGQGLWRIVSVPVVFCRYLGLLSGTVKVDPHHDLELLQSLSDPRLDVSLVLCGLLAGFLIYAWRRKLKHVVFFSAWLVLTLLPVLRLGGFGDVILADRFLYLPSVGYAALLMMAADFLYKRLLVWRLNQSGRRVCLMGVAVYLLILTLQVNLYGAVWKNDLRLFSHAVLSSPESAYVYNNYGSALATRGKHNAALKAYATAVNLVPQYGSVYTKMGFSLKQLGRYEEAIECFMQARRLGHHSVMLYNNMGFSLRRLGWLHQAERCYRLSLLLEPDAPALNNLAEIMIAQGQYGQAVPLLEQSLLIEETVEAYNNLGLCRWEEGRTDAALALYRRALKMLYGHGDPQAEHVVLSNMANVLYEKQDIASAERQTRLVLELQRELGVK